ncbi:MAG TPA: lytic murein transglycosylase [Solirubrobacteraceae bacterium]|nr:lytic murein transglycosylase [Solirubrobacteraceae bacterium]
MHHKRRLLIALAMTGGMTAGLGTFASPANAVVRTFEVELVGGIKKTITLDIGADTPLDQIRLPGLNAAILSIRETTPAQAPSSGALPSLSITPTAPGQQAPVVPGAPAVETPTDTQTARSGKKKRKAASQPVFDSRGRLLRSPLPERARPKKTRLRFSNGSPTLTNPTLSLASIGPVPVGVPNFFINKFRIPPFLLSIYQAAGIQYGIRWEVLAAINEIETDYGRNLNVSSAGAMGWMQFIPSSWKSFGVDANGDGKKDPYNPVDAIFAAARYLKAAGADTDLRKAIFAYNHADWYVDSVLMRARFIGGMPADLVGSLSGLTQGLFPVHAAARYADDISEREAERRVARGKNAALPVESKTTRRAINIFAKAGSPVIAVQDGKIIKIGNNARLGNFVMLRDVYGNTYTYGGLKKLAKQVPVPKKAKQTKESIAKELALPKADPTPTQPASAGSNKAGKAVRKVKAAADSSAKVLQETAQIAKERLFANPTRPNALSAGGKQQILESESALGTGTSVKSYFTGVYGLNRDDVVLKRLVPGRRVIAGTILGRIGKVSQTVAPHVMFEIRPAGRGAPRIDPKPILDGWKLLESTAIYRAQGKNPFFGENARGATIGQILLMSKDNLIQRVLANPRIEIYSCGRRDIQAGIVDRRVLATLEFLAGSGLKPAVTSLRCGHGFYTSTGNVSAHSSGNAVDIAKINGIPILGNQGAGSITDIAVRRLLTLQGTMKPAQIITLMKYEATDNTISMSDHHDHIHVGFRPEFDPRTKAGKIAASVLKPSQWIKLIDRLGQIDNPTVRLKPSKYAIKVGAQTRASRAHQGD